MKRISKLLVVLSLLISTSLNVFADTTENKSLADKAFTPIGWAIGAAVTPAYIGIEYSSKSLGWLCENVAAPAASGALWIYAETWDGLVWITAKSLEGVAIGSKYTVVPIARGIYWGMDKSFDYVIFPAMEATLRYAVVPAGKSLFWSIDKAADRIVWGAEYTVVPFAKGSVWGTKMGTKYVILPVYNGTINGITYIAVPAGKGIKWGAKYTFVPVAQGLGYGAEAFENGLMRGANIAGNGLRWTSVNVIYPIGYGVGKGIDTVVAPIGHSVKATTSATKKAVKKILGKN